MFVVVRRGRTEEKARWNPSCNPLLVSTLSLRR